MTERVGGIINVAGSCMMMIPDGCPIHRGEQTEGKRLRLTSTDLCKGGPEWRDAYGRYQPDPSCEKCKLHTSS